jgi:DNA-binding response OmpR family regulator
MSYTILSIEDEAEISELLSVVLDNPQVKLTTVNTALDGLTKIREQRPSLVLLDIMLPDMDGWSVYDSIRKDPLTRDIPIIMLTVLRREFQPRRVFEVGPHDAYMTKPFNMIDLRAQVETMLGQKLW